MIGRIIIEGVLQHALQRNRSGWYACPHSPISFRVRVKKIGARNAKLCRRRPRSVGLLPFDEPGYPSGKTVAHTPEMICSGQDAKSMGEGESGREPAFLCNEKINATERPERGSFDARSDFSFAVYCRLPFSGKSRHSFSR